MKRLTEITAHLFFWIVFTAITFMLSKIYLQAEPDAPFSQHLFYVVFLELIMGLIFFYTTFLSIPWARKKKLLFLLYFPEPGKKHELSIQNLYNHKIV